MDAYLIWLIAGVLLILSEVVATSVIAVFFGISSIVVGILMYFGLLESATWQFTLFAGLSVALWVTARKQMAVWFKGDTDDNRDKSNFVSDSIGETAVVLDAFEGRGRVKLNGAHWDARCDTPLESDQEVRVVRNESTILIVEPLK